MTTMQQKLTHNKAAKYSQRLTSKIATLRKEKVKRVLGRFTARLHVTPHFKNCIQSHKAVELKKKQKKYNVLKIQYYTRHTKQHMYNVVILVHQNMKCSCTSFSHLAFSAVAAGE